MALAEYRMDNYSGANSAAVEAAGNAYLENPTYANYIAFNRAEYGEPAGDPDDYDFAYEGVPTWPGLEGEHPVVNDLSFAVESIDLYVGEKETLEASEDKNIVWTSSDKSVATVSKKGVVTAKAEGTCEITAVAPGDRAATVTVNVALKPTLAVTPESVSIEEGETKTLDVTFENAPEGAELVWTSSNPLVATVADGVITAVAVGEATVTATWEDLTATVAVTVTEKVGEDGINSIEADAKNKVYDVRGIRLDKASQGGVYIINGKKVVK